MQHRLSRRGRLVASPALVVMLAFAAYAFTAANTVPDTKAGDGNGTISGYTVSNVAYQLEAANPANLESVSFTLDDTAGTVKAKVVASSTTYTDCTNMGGNDWSCDFGTNPTVLSADQLRVIATS